MYEGILALGALCGGIFAFVYAIWPEKKQKVEDKIDYGAL